MIPFQGQQGLDQSLFDRIQTVEDQILEPLFAYFLPDVLHRIELGAVGRKEVQTHVIRYLERIGFMPARAIQKHVNERFAVPLSHLGQEDRHRLGVHLGKNQGIQRPIVG